MRDYVIDLFRVPVRLAVWLLALLCLTFVGLAQAADATLTWEHPTAYEDDSPLPPADLKETVLEWGRCVSGAFPPNAEGSKAIPAPATTGAVTGLAANVQWCFRAATVVVAGEQSAWSETATGIWLRKPKPPRLSGPASTSGSMTVVIEQ